jgi:hypothetical protein
MARLRKLEVCDLHKKGICHIEKAGPIVDTEGLVKGQKCKGKVCEDFEYRFICSNYPIEKEKF